MQLPDSTTIDISLEQTRHEGKIVGKRVLGLPIYFEDSVVNKVNFQPASINIKNGELSKSDIDAENSNFSVNFNVDFNRQIIILTYFNYGDLVSYLGGIKSAIMPAFGLIVPIVMLSFLVSLVSII